MNKEENLYQFIFKTILNNINKQQHQNQQYFPNDDDNLQDELNEFSERKIDNDIISLLQRIITSNESVWNWVHFFNYLLKDNSNNSNNSNNGNNNNLFILQLNKELQIELLNWFLTLLRCVNNENSPSNTMKIPIYHLKNLIIKSYLKNNKGYSIYKEDYLFSFIIDSILSDIDFLIDSNQNNNNSNNSSSIDIGVEEENFQQIESIGIYYPFTVTFDKEFNKFIGEKLNKLNIEMNEREDKEMKKQDENKMNVDQEVAEQQYNYYSNAIKEIIDTEFGNNRISSFLNNTDQCDQNPYRHQDLTPKNSRTEQHLLNDKLLTNINDLMLDDKEFYQFNNHKQDDLHLQDWSVQFQTLIPEFNNINMDIESMLTKGITTESEPKERIPSVNKTSSHQEEYEDHIASSPSLDKQMETKQSITESLESTSIRKLQNEEITSIIAIKDFIRNDNNTNNNLGNLLEPLLLISDVGEAIKLLEANTYSEDQFVQFISTIISLDFSFLSLSQFFSSLLLPKALDVKNKSERMFLDLLGSCFKQHHTAFIGSFMVPLIVRNEEFQAPQKEIIIKLLQIKDIDSTVKIQFVSSLLVAIQKNQHFIWNESVIWIFTTIIQLKLLLNEKIFSDLFEVLTIASKPLSKNQKFATLMLTTISSYQKNIKEFVPKIEQLLLNMQINVKGSLNLLEKIKNS
ncbi:hypothetical protein DICPUDRAFT_78145 [Dictyostelium purpureum]|uniref:Uncharacterized protein n=1 Tax=Dictyostelium purpureum TaxID=5786 RepID=F0ZIP2_DICPU|nr:uncharacterized protein DICPUDRAFT_78145 [Dictyostelium purpureum]EGC36204.1 hypothetical protein DICPUDRAFT_78145 [Dictyostelium purpureum]|eukprot:XP_003287271.1 hypothetical protein DICPUDRAFT_78145 [Dictyostelium purpureum]